VIRRRPLTHLAVLAATLVAFGGCGDDEVLSRDAADQLAGTVAEIRQAAAARDGFGYEIAVGKARAQVDLLQAGGEIDRERADEVRAALDHLGGLSASVRTTTTTTTTAPPGRREPEPEPERKDEKGKAKGNGDGEDGGD
jgi:hypothetical protein